MVSEDALAALKQWLRERIAEILKCSPSEVDARASFSSMGLDSLSLINLTGDLADYLGRDLSAPLLLEYSTIDSLVAHLNDARDLPPPIAPRQRGHTPLPVSFSQERILGYSRLGPEGDTNTLCDRFFIRGDLDLEAFQLALDEAVRRHEVLRTTFTMEAGKGVQVVHPPGPVNIEMTDLSADARPEEAALNIFKRTATEPMDLQRGPLFRTLLLRLGENDYRVIFLLHHLLCDAEALVTFYEDIRGLYGAARGTPRPPEPDLQAADFAIWEREWLHKEGKAYQSRMAWWQQHWSGAMPAPLKLPFLWKDPGHAVPSSQECVRAEKLSEELREQLKTLAREQKTNPYALYLAAFAVVLWQLTGEEDLVIGTYVSSRHHSAVRRLMGAFVSMMPVRIRLAGAATFREVLHHTRDVLEQASSRQDLPYADLQNTFHQAGKPAPDVRVIFQYVQYTTTYFALPGLEADRWVMDSKPAMPWGCTMTMVKTSDLSMNTGMDGKLYDPAGLPILMRAYRELLQKAAADPHLPLTRQGFL
jgi:acyl carrier protein